MPLIWAEQSTAELGDSKVRAISCQVPALSASAVLERKARCCRRPAASRNEAANSNGRAKNSNGGCNRSCTKVIDYVIQQQRLPLHNEYLYLSTCSTYECKCIHTYMLQSPQPQPPGSQAASTDSTCKKRPSVAASLAAPTAGLRHQLLGFPISATATATAAPLPRPPLPSKYRRRASRRNIQLISQADPLLASAGSPQLGEEAHLARILPVLHSSTCRGAVCLSA